eukprot:6121733-Pyramimonas_sp.AAC.1
MVWNCVRRFRRAPAWRWLYGCNRPRAAPASGASAPRCARRSSERCGVRCWRRAGASSHTPPTSRCTPPP